MRDVEFLVAGAGFGLLADEVLHVDDVYPITQRRDEVFEVFVDPEVAAGVDVVHGTVLEVTTGDFDGAGRVRVRSRAHISFASRNCRLEGGADGQLAVGRVPDWVVFATEGPPQ